MTINEKLEAIYKQYIDTARQEFEAGIKVIFDKYPEIITISWTAYTPSWNDGDPCTYRSNHDYPELNENFGEDDDNLPSPIPEIPESAEEEVREFLRNFDDDCMKQLFGDGIRVILTRKETITEEYDCGY